MSTCRLCRDPLAGRTRLVISPAPAGAQLFGATAGEARARAITLEIVECASCGLIQSGSPPVEGHRRAITAAGTSGPMREHRKAQALRLTVHLGRSGSRIALVGCGNGYELPILAEVGFDPVGIEWGGPPVGYDGHWPVLDGYPAPDAPLPGAPYDAFACYNFLEHANDPRAFLASIASALAPPGCGVVEVPNYEKQCTEGRAADYVADHLCYFDARTFRAMLVVSGFDVISLNEVRAAENLEAIVRVHQESSLDRDRELLGEAQRSVAGFFARWRAAGSPALAWGASHQALTLLAGVPTADLPSAIIDNAPFKHGMFAPASGIPVVAPSGEALAGAGAVLVIASGYEAEIVRTLRARLAFTGEVWAVRGQGVHRLG